MIINQLDIPSAIEINHKNGAKDENAPSNLELVTRSENVIHSFRILNHAKKAQNGELNAGAKLTEIKVSEIRALWSAKAMSQRLLAARYGVTQGAISAVVRGKSWPISG